MKLNEIWQNPSRSLVPPGSTVVFKRCALFDQTLEKHSRNPKIEQLVTQFLALKTSNPLQPFGAKDRPFRGNGNFAGFSHAGLTFDISLIYKISGRGPTVISLYAIATHDESGTGTPANINRQKQLRNKLDSQVF